MSLGKVNVLRRVPFSLRRGDGTPAIGVSLASMSVLVRNSNNAATLDASATVTEDGLGDYYFEISAAFSDTNGGGVYYGNITINDAAPVLRDVVPFEIEFFINDVDDLDVAIGLAETEASAATREATNTTEHAATLAAIGLLPSAAANAAAVFAFDVDAVYSGLTARNLFGHKIAWMGLLAINPSRTDIVTQTIQIRNLADTATISSASVADESGNPVVAFPGAVARRTTPFS